MNRVEPIFVLLQEVLTQQIVFLKNISSEAYTYKIPTLDGASIGGHTRHLIEFLQVLQNAYPTNFVDYEERNRNLEIEQNPEMAIKTITNLLSILNLPNKNLILKHIFGDVSIEIPTNFHRELLYNIEHCIHHQALIKVAFNEMKMSHLLHENFGVAPSTVKYRTSQNLN